jgi:PhoH-like ATPase
MIKTYILDSNVLLHDPVAFQKFQEHRVIIPIYVLEEIDKFKKDQTELGRNARQIARELDDLRSPGVSLFDGVELASGGKLSIDYCKDAHDKSWYLSQDLVDNKILLLASIIKTANTNPTVLVTKDINLRVRADALGITAEDYKSTKIHTADQYTGHRDIQVTGEDVDKFYFSGWLDIPEDLSPLAPNEYCTLIDSGNPSHAALAKHDWKTQRIVALPKHIKNGAWGLRPRNKEQNFAMDLLLNEEIKLVTISGRAGGGKTLLSVACGLQKAIEDTAYNKVLVSRPIMPMGKDLGYLPGTLEEKIGPWMQPIVDSVEFLMGLGKTEKRSGRSYEELVDMGMIAVEPLTYIRGRSIPNQFMIVDEAQNLTMHEVKTILTRAGEGTKIILTGDPDQIDSPYIDSESNGLSYILNKFRDQKIAGHITLQKGERSILAELAATIL